MNQHYDSASPSSPSPAPQVHNVQVAAKPGGIWRAISIVGGLMLFLIVFVMGLVFGMVAMMMDDTVVVEQTYRDGARDRIAILPVEGVIGSSQAEFVRTAVDHILADRRVKAVVLRVDSPGGGVTASDQIWYQVNRLKESRMPVIASYGGVAASGGYYVSCGTDYIFAEDTCITGSIGVIAQLFTMEDLMGKVGIEPVTLVATDSPEKDIANNIFRQWDDRDRQRILTILDAAQNTFIERVRNGRQHVITDPDHLRSVTTGAIFTAGQALEKGLIDEVGYLDDAITHAERAAGLRPGQAHVVRLNEPVSLFGGGLFQAKLGARTQSLDAEQLRSFVNDLASPRAMYLMH
jgi:protease IV